MSAARFAYREKSGFFPFYIFPPSRVTNSNVDLGTTAGLNITAPLPTLSKIFWLAKSFDWAVNIAWSRTSGGTTINETLIGGGTVDLSSILPAGRVVRPSLNNSPGYWQRNFPVAFQSCGVTSTGASNPSAPQINWTTSELPPGSNAGQDVFDMLFFNSQHTIYPDWPGGFDGGIGGVVLDPTDGQYKTSIQSDFGGYLSSYNTLNSAGLTASAVVFDLILDGVTYPIPFYSNGTSESGAVTVNFNSFFD
jgi:hypothetical protein